MNELAKTLLSIFLCCSLILTLSAFSKQPSQVKQVVTLPFQSITYSSTISDRICIYGLFSDQLQYYLDLYVRMGVKESKENSYMPKQEIIPPHEEKYREEEDEIPIKKAPLTHRSTNTTEDSHNKREHLSLEKFEKKQLIKERPKLGELKLKKVKEMRRYNKQNDEGEEVESLTMKLNLDREIPSDVQFYNNEPVLISRTQPDLLRTNESEARSKKYRISKML